MATGVKAASLTHQFATAEDGTQLSYYTIGTGPGLLIVHGAASFALTLKELAILLSPYFTVHLMSRRARGQSGAYPASITDPSPLSDPSATVTANSKPRPRVFRPEFSAAIIETDTSDIRALVTATNSQFLLGHSSGALLTLNYLLTHPLPASPIKKAILYEPPVFFSDLPSPEFKPLLTRSEAEHATDDPVRTMIGAIKTTQMGPWRFPRWALRLLITRLIVPGQERAAAQRKAEGGGEEGVSTMLELAKTVKFDWAVGEGSIGSVERMKGLDVERVLLMGGDKSVGYLGEGLTVLEELVGAKKVVFEGAGHEMLCGKEQRGHPERAISAIREFLGQA